MDDFLWLAPAFASSCQVPLSSLVGLLSSLYSASLLSLHSIHLHLFSSLFLSRPIFIPPKGYLFTRVAHPEEFDVSASSSHDPWSLLFLLVF